MGELPKIKMFCDNKGAVDIAHNNNQPDNTKHIDIKIKFGFTWFYPALVVLAFIASGTAFVTGVATYFAIKPSERSKSDTVDSKGKIQNNNTFEIELRK